MKKYISKSVPRVVVEAVEVKKDTTINSPIYGDILVTKGNFILTHVDGDQQGMQAGTTPQDLDALYEPYDPKKDYSPPAPKE